MKSLTTIVGILLIILSIGSFAYQGFTYTTQEKVAEVGNLQLTAEKEKVVWVSPIVSGLALVAGIVLVVVGRNGRQ